MIRRLLWPTLGSLGALALAFQLVPYRVNNPPVVEGPQWDSAQTERLARRACFDCHSNEVEVPWYGHVAPFSWLVRSHVDEGRMAVNFSEMHRPQEEAHESGEEVMEGEMPPQYYVMLHPNAQLSSVEREQLAKGLDATLGSEEGEGHAGERSAEHEHEDSHEEDDD